MTPVGSAGPPQDFRAVLASLEPKPEVSAAREDKHAYASRLSRSLAVLVAGALRSHFPGIVPTADDAGHESPTGSSEGKKRLDVKAWNDALGLELLVSIKTYSFRDWSTRTRIAGRYTKNVKRNGMELKDEADVIHRRQPYAVMVALFFLPVDACDDGLPGSKSDVQGVSSFASIVRRLRLRQGRSIDPGDRSFDRFDLAENLYVGLYEYADPAQRGWLRFYDVADNPPRTGRPPGESLVPLEDLVVRIRDFVKQRNTAGFDWGAAAAEFEAEDDED
jgi:hypothetical protein